MMRAIEHSVAKQHRRIDRRAYVIVASVTVIGVISAILFINNEDLAKAVQDTQLGMKELKSEMDKSMRSELDRYEVEISGLKGKLGKEEIKIARLIVELEARGKGLDLLKMRQDLSEVQRKALVLSSTRKMEELAKLLHSTQQELRTKAGNDRWARLVSRYQNGVFLVVAHSRRSPSRTAQARSSRSPITGITRIGRRPRRQMWVCSALAPSSAPWATPANSWASTSARST